MRLLIRDHLSNAYESLRSNRLRTFLTALGVTIGVASITAILSLSGGINATIKDQIAALGGNIAVIRPGVAISQTDIVQQQNYATSTISEADLKEIQKVPNVQAVAPLMIINGNATANSESRGGTNVIGSTPELQDIAGLQVRDGQFIDTTTNQQTAVIGHQLSIDLFGTEQSIGSTFTIRGERFTVIGVLKRLNDPVNFNNVDFDTAAIIHLQAAKRFNHGDIQIQQINVRATSAKELPGVISTIDIALKKAHGGDKDYSIISGAAIAEPSSRMFVAIRGITIAIAGISLVVGGIGIMNIMLVSVAERTREIGLRKAIGASNAHIVWQFLIESLIIGSLGGVVGYITGYIAAFAISTFLTFEPIFSWDILGIAVGLSLLVGVTFGLYPAIRASRKDPIESLRHYH